MLINSQSIKFEVIDGSDPNNNNNNNFPMPNPIYDLSVIDSVFVVIESIQS